MTLTAEQRREIFSLLEETMKKKLQKYKRETSYMPFLATLIQDREKVAAYSFLHSIATTLGMSIYEQISVIIAKPHSEKAERNVKIEGKISPSQKSRISRIVNELREGKRKANKKIETQEVLKEDTANAKNQKDGKIADFYMKRNNKEYYFEIKTTKPNIDVFTKSKTKLLEWIARTRKPINTILAFPYNPYYPEPYQRFTEQGVVEHGTEFLIAEEYWDMLGGKGTFGDLLEVFDKAGKKFKKEIATKIEEIAKKKYD